MQPHPLTNFVIPMHYQNEPKFGDFYSRNDLPEIKDGGIALELNIFQKKLKNS